MEETGKTATGKSPLSSKNEILSGCQAQTIFNHITSKWGVKTIIVLMQGELRFSQLKRHLHNITDRMLIKTLHELEEDGLICREFNETERNKAFYSLSSEGNELAVILKSVTEWVQSFSTRSS
ncbi:TPA: helix-turn-helix transcriptional regulator [Klebsiella variicola]|nr:helix-turn-helix transcriptional regulator [Klebsiella variicola]